MNAQMFFDVIATYMHSYSGMYKCGVSLSADTNELHSYTYVTWPGLTYVHKN